MAVVRFLSWNTQQHRNILEGNEAITPVSLRLDGHMPNANPGPPLPGPLPTPAASPPATHCSPSTSSALRPHCSSTSPVPTRLFFLTQGLGLFHCLEKGPPWPHTFRQFFFSFRLNRFLLRAKSPEFLSQSLPILSTGMHTHTAPCILFCFMANELVIMSLKTAQQEQRQYKTGNDMVSGAKHPESERGSALRSCGAWGSCLTFLI